MPILLYLSFNPSLKAPWALKKGRYKWNIKNNTLTIEGRKAKTLLEGNKEIKKESARRVVVL